MITSKKVCLLLSIFQTSHQSLNTIITTDLHIRWVFFLLFDIILWWENATPLPVCQAVFLISCLYHLNVLPYIPLANTGCLWICNPKNTKLHISILYTHTHKTEGANHSALQCHPCSYLTPSMLCSQDQLWRGSWDLLHINGPVG